MADKKDIAGKIEEVVNLVKTLDEDVMNLYQGLASLYEKAEDVENRFSTLESEIRAIIEEE